MTLYRLLHGQEWYSGSPAPRATIASGGFAKRLTWLPHVPQRWRRALRSMMADDRATRPDSADQVWRILGELPVQLAWNCAVEPGRVRWERTAGPRLIRAEWWWRSVGEHTWEAWSKTSGGGAPADPRQRPGGRPGRPVGVRDVLRGPVLGCVDIQDSRAV